MLKTCKHKRSNFVWHGSSCTAYNEVAFDAGFTCTKILYWPRNRSHSSAFYSTILTQTQSQPENEQKQPNCNSNPANTYHSDTHPLPLNLGTNFPDPNMYM